jgi:protein O-mannosyl-transferase
MQRAAIRCRAGLPINVNRAEETLLVAHRTLLPVALLGLATFLCYANSLQGVFLLDDRVAVVEAATIRSIDWTGWVHSFRGLVDLSFALNYAAGGLNRFGYHLVNVLVHLLAGLTLFGLVRRTLESPRLAGRYAGVGTALAAAIALLWLVHPLATQAVTYIVQRYESVAALFYLLALYCFRRGCDSRRPAAWWVAVVLCYALGLRSKEIVITLPLVLLWYDRAFVAARWRDVLQRRRLYVALLAVGAWLAGQVVLTDLRILGEQALSGEQDIAHGQAALTVPGLSPVKYFLSQPGVLLHYLRLSVMPTQQCFDYGWQPRETVGEILPPLMAVSALGLATLWCAKHRPAFGFLGGAWFLVLAPTSSFIPIQDLAVEHRMYLPLAAVLAGLVIAGYEIWMRCLALPHLSAGVRKFVRWSAPLLLALAAVSFAAETVMRNRLYQSAINLWTDVCIRRPDFWRGHFHLSKALYEDGDVEGTLQELSSAIRLQPGISDPWATRGTVWVRLGKLDEALHDFSRAIDIDPDLPTPYYNRAMVRFDRGDFAAAVADCDRAIELKPDYVKAYLGRGAAYVELAQFESALRDYDRAVQLDPAFVPAYQHRAALHVKQGDLQAARADVAAGRRVGGAIDPKLSADLQLAPSERPTDD